MFFKKMKKVLLFLLLNAVSVFSLASCDDSDSTEISKASETEILNKFKSSVVKIYTYDMDGIQKTAQGSGFYYDTVGGMVTNYHVLEDAYSAKIKRVGQTGQTEIKKVYSGDYKTSDYCLCDSNLTSTSKVTFNDNYKEGQTVYAVGFPDDSYNLKVTKGKIIGTAVDGKKTYIENTAFIDHGSSGGVLINKDLEVIGITTGQLANGNYAAIPYSDFSSAVSRTYYTGKDVLHYFHNVQDITLSAYNFESYFNVNSVKTNYSQYNTQDCYTVTLTIKPAYASKTIINGSYISVGFKVNTRFTIYDGRTTSYQDVYETNYIKIYDFNMNSGANGYYCNTLRNSDIINKRYTMKSTYDITSVSGSISIVD